jgi:hypothetical protein
MGGRDEITRRLLALCDGERASRHQPNGVFAQNQRPVYAAAVGLWRATPMNITITYCQQ